MTSSDSGVHNIRPAGRHLMSIGRELIHDKYAAVVELVKNAYDADSSEVSIQFSANVQAGKFHLVISDHGHGMSRDVVLEKWMVPSTPDKLTRRESPGGRVMQGRKGIGRFAASILGQEMMLETTTQDGQRTELLINWGEFESAEFLDDVDILVETKKVEEKSGTTLTIAGGAAEIEYWEKGPFEKLIFELKKLLPPESVRSDEGDLDGDFVIKLKIEGFEEQEDKAEEISPFPIFDFFDYKVSGAVNAEGNGKLVYSNKRAKNVSVEEIDVHLGQATGCGSVRFDLRVYDREASSLDALIRRGLKDEAGNFVGRLKARQILNTSNGVSVFRNGFRIRPMGDADFDWLFLNEGRIQNPSLRIGSNQIIGYVRIESEEKSGLEEKSARDGLKDNEAFEALRSLTKLVLALLEERRFAYRKKTRLGGRDRKVDQKIDDLFDTQSLKDDVSRALKKANVRETTSNKIIELIEQDSEKKSDIAEEIRKEVAVYQGQATLGKIMNVVLHEGRRPLNYFSNEIPNLEFWTSKFSSGRSEKSAREIIKVGEGIGRNAGIFVNLFKRLDPLASGKRGPKTNIKVKAEVEHAFEVFQTQLVDLGIEIKIGGKSDVQHHLWKQDLYEIFVNLVDNSIFWMVEKSVQEKRISVEITGAKGKLVQIDLRDTGPGIDSNHIESGVIFEPEFSTKVDGTGLGLAIAGEAARRSGLELQALDSDTGAHFRLVVRS